MRIGGRAEALRYSLSYSLRYSAMECRPSGLLVRQGFQSDRTRAYSS
jgi:hypothetical protein